MKQGCVPFGLGVFAGWYWILRGPQAIKDNGPALLMLFNRSSNALPQSNTTLPTAFSQRECQPPVRFLLPLVYLAMINGGARTANISKRGGAIVRSQWLLRAMTALSKLLGSSPLKCCDPGTTLGLFIRSNFMGVFAFMSRDTGDIMKKCPEARSPVLWSYQWRKIESLFSKWQ